MFLAMLALLTLATGCSGGIMSEEAAIATATACECHCFPYGSRQYTEPTGTPTPTGTYYLTELLQPPDVNGVYGPYAYGLSAYSPVLTDFAGGTGQIGLHGTNEPAGVGTDVSHGCIRVANGVITRLAHNVPPGTPISIDQ